MADTELQKRHREGKQKHGKPKDPEMTRKGPLAHPGSIIIGLAGTLFVAYVFNVQGLQTTLDGLLGGLDHSVKSHGGQVTTYFIFLLPLAAVLIGGAIFSILFSALKHAILGSIKEGQKKKAKALAKALEAKEGKPKVAEPMVLVRPTRLDRKDVGIPHVAGARR